MSNGVLIFEGMKVGVLPGDFTVEVNEQGVLDGKIVLSTAYNVLPIWIRAAHDQLRAASVASEAIRTKWSTNDQTNRELLIQELQPCIRPDVPVGVDWKFSAYKYSNAERCFRATTEMLIYLYERKCPVPEVAAEMDRAFLALEELKVVTRNQPLKGKDESSPSTPSA
jgi:hypothetical protein